MNAQLTKLSGSRNYFQAFTDARNARGRLVSSANLDAYKMAGNLGAFWARELKISGVPLRVGMDIKDAKSGLILPADALKIVHEKSQDGIFGRRGLVLLADPEGFSDHNGLKVIEAPLIKVVETPILKYGGMGKLDPQTGIAVKVSRREAATLAEEAKRWNYFNKGIWPLVRGYGYVYNRRDVDAFLRPSLSFGVLVEGATAQPQKEEPAAQIVVPAVQTGLQALAADASQALQQIWAGISGAFAEVAAVQKLIDAVAKQ